jgi:hypothetical protein
MHKAEGIVIFDYATAAPYVKVYSIIIKTVTFPSSSFYCRWI